jgi:hypothetical protein
MNVTKVFTSIADVSEVVRIIILYIGNHLRGAQSLSSQQLTRYSRDMPQLLWNLRIQ